MMLLLLVVVQSVSLGLGTMHSCLCVLDSFALSVRSCRLLRRLRVACATAEA